MAKFVDDFPRAVCRVNEKIFGVYTNDVIVEILTGKRGLKNVVLQLLTCFDVKFVHQI